MQDNYGIYNGGVDDDNDDHDDVVDYDGCC
jgi:hypothetical protein